MAASRGDHASCPPGTMLNSRYKVLRECGCGNFSKVFECHDTKNNNALVAVKLLKKEYASDAAFEKEILVALGEKDRSNNKKVAKLLDYFVYNRHPTFVFPLKGPSLRSCKLGVTRGNVPAEEMKQFAQELLETMRFLHADARLVHTDLKPENILLDQSLGKEQKGIGSGWTICDFGSASFLRKDRLDCDLISTRPYRAPEVVMGNGWHTAADIWSLACVLFEVQAGSRLFEVHDDAEHLHAFEARLKRLPSPLKMKSKHSSKFFNPDGTHRRPSSKPVRPMSEVLKEHPEFADLLSQMLEFDSDKRISAEEALKHPYFHSSRKENVQAAAPSTAPVTSAPVDEPLPKKYNPSPAGAETSARPLRERSISQENGAAVPKKKVQPSIPLAPAPEKRFVGAPNAVQAAREMAKLRIGEVGSAMAQAQVVAAGKPSYLRPVSSRPF